MHPNCKNEKGKQHGRLVVLERSGTSKDRAVIWLCRCFCGKEVPVKGVYLRNGNTKSCGCLNRELSTDRIRVIAKRQTGSANPRYNKGLCIRRSGHDTGRCSVMCRDGSEVHFSRIIMEGFLGRELNPEFVVHHRDNDSSNDIIENLSLFPNQSTHTKHHNTAKT